jgi:chromosome segregation ATPase
VADPQEEVGKRTLDQKEAELKKAKGEIAKLKAELVSLKKSEPEGKNDGLSQKDAEQGKAKSEIANLSAELDNLKKKEQAGNETLKESRQLEREVDRKPSQETSEKSDNESCEYKLAVIQNGGYLSESDPLVGKFRVHLDSIMRKTGEDRNRIGDLVVLTQNLLKERGVIENLETVIYALDGSLPEELSPGVIKLEEIVAAYVVLRTGGTK